MSPIVKIFTGRHIDLSKVVSITDAFFINRMGSGGWYVAFDIECQMLDHRIRFKREFDFSEYEFQHEHLARMTDGSLISDRFELELREKEILAVANLQAQVDELINLWKEWKAHEASQR